MLGKRKKKTRRKTDKIHEKPRKRKKPYRKQKNMTGA